MICGWEKRDDYWTNISSPDFGRRLKYRGYLETRELGLSILRGLKKNGNAAAAALVHRSYYDKSVRRIRDLSCGDARIYLEVEVRRVRCKRCGKVKREKLPWLANNPFYTKRFSYYVGRKCRAMTIKDVAKGTETGLACGKGVGQRIHARTASEESGSSAAGNRDRRDSPCGKVIYIGSWSAIWNEGSQSGMAGKIALRRAWICSTNGLAPRRQRR